MTEQKNLTEKPILSNTDLAFERTVMAENRTLMAWIRTSISLISFGFTIYKFFNELAAKSDPVQRIFTPRKFGMVMIGFGLLALLLGLMEYHYNIKKFRKNYADIQFSKATLLAIIIFIFGLVLFLGVLFRQ